MMAVLTTKDNPPAGREHAGNVILAANCAVGRLEYFALQTVSLQEVLFWQGFS